MLKLQIIPVATRKPSPKPFSDPIDRALPHYNIANGYLHNLYSQKPTPPNLSNNKTITKKLKMPAVLAAGKGWEL